MEAERSSIAEGFNPYGYISDGKIYLKSFLHFPSRQIGEVIHSEETSVQYFEAKFVQFASKVQAVIDAIDTTENKGSYLEKLLHLKSLIGKQEALGDFASLFKKIEEKEAELQSIISKNRVRNLALKQDLLAKLEELKESTDWINTTPIIRELRNQWIRIGSVEKQASDEIEAKFNGILDYYFGRRNAFYEELNRLNEEKRIKLEGVLTRLKMLVDSGDYRKAVIEHKALQAEWMSIGMIPKRSMMPLKTQFKQLTKTLFKRVKEQRSRMQNKPVVIDVSIMAKFQQLLKLQSTLQEILQNMPDGGEERIKKLQEEWKNVGYIKHDDYRKLNFNFSNNCIKGLDLYFLRRVCLKRIPEFDSLSPLDQLKNRVMILKELIVRDAEQIQNFENSFVPTTENSSEGNFDRVFGAKLESQKRRLHLKQLLLAELENKLNKSI